MSEWWTYRLSDFLMFSPATYWRTVERYNLELWPLQLVMPGVGLALLWMVAARKPMAGRATAGVLAAAWAWVGWAFHWERYAPINWAAQYLAGAFALQALLLLGAAVAGRRGVTPAGSRARAAGAALAVLGVLAYPFLAIAQARPWSQAEVFGVMPEPTALATLGLLLAARPAYRGWLMVVPVLSLGVGAATLWLLQA